MAGKTLSQLLWTEDALLDGRIRLRQLKSGYRVTSDSVLLAAAVPAKPGDHVVDVGTGSGAAALCLLARVPECRVTGVELQPALAELATVNGNLNGTRDRFRVVIANMLKHTHLAGKAEEKEKGKDTGKDEGSGQSLLWSTFDHVMSNPPFAAVGTPSPDPIRATARSTVDLRAWITACVNLLRPQGFLTMIHRADALDQLLVALRDTVGGIEVIPLWPRAGLPARRLIVRGRKGSRASTVLHAGLILHTAAGYTMEAESILRQGHALYVGLKESGGDAPAP